MLVNLWEKYIQACTEKKENEKVSPSLYFRLFCSPEILPQSLYSCLILKNDKTYKTNGAFKRGSVENVDG